MHRRGLELTIAWLVLLALLASIRLEASLAMFVLGVPVAFWIPGTLFLRLAPSFSSRMGLIESSAAIVVGSVSYVSVAALVLDSLPSGVTANSLSLSVAVLLSLSTAWAVVSPSRWSPVGLSLPVGVVLSVIGGVGWLAAAQPAASLAALIDHNLEHRVPEPQVAIWATCELSGRPTISVTGSSNQQVSLLISLGFDEAQSVTTTLALGSGEEVVHFATPPQWLRVKIAASAEDPEVDLMLVVRRAECGDQVP